MRVDSVNVATKKVLFKNIKLKILSEIKKNMLTIIETTGKGAIITLPINYKVGTDVLDIYLNGERLLKASTTDSEGHYYEVGEADSISNQIKITDDWNLDAGDIIEIVVRGEYTDDTE